jgi:hypothetical protein
MAKLDGGLHSPVDGQQGCARLAFSPVDRLKESCHLSTSNSSRSTPDARADGGTGYARILQRADSASDGAFPRPTTGKGQGCGNAAAPGGGCMSERAQPDERKRGAEEARRKRLRASGASSRLRNSIASGEECP